MNRPFWFPDLQTMVAGSVMFLFGLMMIMLLFVPMPLNEQAGQLLTTLAGMLGGAFVSVVGFYFGSSTGAKAKDDTIAKLAEKPPAPPPSVP